MSASEVEVRINTDVDRALAQLASVKAEVEAILRSKRDPADSID